MLALEDPPDIWGRSLRPTPETRFTARMNSTKDGTGMIFLKNVSLRDKLNRIVMLTTSVALLLAALGFFFFDLLTFRNTEARELSSVADILGANSTASLQFQDPSSGRETLETLSIDPRVVSAGLYTLDGKLFASYNRDRGNSVTLPNQPRKQGAYFEKGQILIFRPILLNGKPIGTIFIRSDLQNLYDRLQQYGIIAFLVLVISLLGAFLLSSKLQKAITSPILHLAHLANRVSTERNYALRAVNDSQDELGDLVNQFNDMLSQIQDRDIALLEAHDKLEEKVLERTRDLENEIQTRRKSENAHRESEERLRSILDHATALVYMKDIDLRYVLVNRQFEKVFGLTHEQVRGKTDPEIFSNELANCWVDRDRMVLESGQPLEVEEQLQVKGKTETYISLKFPLRDSNGAIYAICGLNTNITDRKNFEIEIQKARIEAEAANAAKTAFIANLSHEIRTPLNAIMGYSQILQRDTTLTSQHYQALARIDTSGKNLLSIINDILDISKIEAGRMELHPVNFNMNWMIEDMTTLFKLKCEENGLTLETSAFSEDRCRLYGDEEKIRQVLTNLLANAVKFTDAGTVTLNIIPEKYDHIRFEVRDTGKGILPEAQKTIFEPFKQDAEGIKKGGTGLGLAICRRQVLLMGSELYVSSKPGQGSSFYFTLQLPPSKGAPESPRKRGREVFRLTDDHQVKALVADDNLDNRTVLAHLLKSVGVHVTEAENGLIALEKTRAHLPDIIFMDIRMPVMDGRQAIHEIIDEFGPDRFKIVTITASAMQNDREQFIKLGSHDVILKPFRADDVFECLKNLLGIEYIYSDAPGKETESQESPPMDYSQIRIPKDIHHSLKEAAELHYVTRIRQSLPMLVQSGEEGKKLADSLNFHLKKYDMQKILAILQQVNSEE